MRYQVFPLFSDGQKMNVPDEVLAGIWNQMVAEQKAQKVFYNGYITSVYDFITFMKTGGVLPVIIYDHEIKAPCYISWLSDYGDGHACMHHCSLGQFKRGAFQAIIKYWGMMKHSETGEHLFDTLIGISPESNKDGIRLAKLMGFKLLSPSVPGLCNDVYAGKRVPGVISYYIYNRKNQGESHGRRKK